MILTGDLILIACATAANGILTGASLDQSIKQLPARRKIGMIAFSAYSQAADLGPGIVWYVTIGVGAAVLSILAAAVVYLHATPVAQVWPIYAAAGLSVVHSLATARAAPTNFSQRRVAGDAERLAKIFATFERWQTVRVVVQALTFAAILYGLIAYTTQ